MLPEKNHELRKLEMHYLQHTTSNATNNHFVNLPLPKREQEIIHFCLDEQLDVTKLRW